MESRDETTSSRSKDSGNTGGPLSWAMRLAKGNGNKPAKIDKHEGDNSASDMHHSSGVSQGSNVSSTIKFGTIDPKQLESSGVQRTSQGTVGQKAKGSKNADVKVSHGAKYPERPNAGLMPTNTQPPSLSQGPYPPAQQFSVPYVQQPYQVQGGGFQPFLQNPGQVFYPSNFRQPVSTGYYGGTLVSPVGAQESMQNVQTREASYASGSKVAPPVREKKILRIEDPNTHEALDLKEITSKARTKESNSTEVQDHASSVKEDVKSSVATKETEDLPTGDRPEKEQETALVGESVEQVDQSPCEEDSASEKPPQRKQDAEPLKQINGRIQYTKDFLLSLRSKCKALPPYVEPATLSALFAKQATDRGEWKSNNGKGPPPPPRGRGPRQRSSGADADTWERGKPLPPQSGYGRGPPPGMRVPGPLPALHKSDAAYKLGRTKGEDPEEEAAQKALKSMLNKITPENFKKITEQIVEKINERKKAKTLMGFIDQIFDKALRETTFAELYADLVSKLNPALPDLTDDDGNPVNFRRALLNKCQEEFDYGVNAMKAVAERERREEEKDKGGRVSDDEIEDNQMTDEDRSRMEGKAEKMRLEKAAADAEVKARKRMLGNIIFVGQLYRFGVLIEAVMHSCIKQLLEETEHPRPEDIECLCKLLATVGRPMDASKREIKRPDGTTIKTSDMMEVYFRRIELLTKSDVLDARHKFMLKDLVDLRRQNWIERRKAEGPKKIGDIHRDAAIERSKSQQFDRQPKGRERASQRQGFDNRIDAPIRIMSATRVSSDTDSLRPGGRPGPAKSQAKPAKPIVMNEDNVQRKVKGLLEELFHNGDVKEAVFNLGELKDSGAQMDLVVDLMLTSSLEGKGTSWDLLKALFKQARNSSAILPDQLQKGTRSLLNKLEDIRVDVPKAPEQMGDVFSFLLHEECLDINQLMIDIREADIEEPMEGEDTQLVDSGAAKDLLGYTLKGLKGLREEGEISSQLKSMDLGSYFPGYERDDPGQIASFKKKFDIEDLL